MSSYLDYARPAAKEPPGWGYFLILFVNVCSLCALIAALPSMGIPSGYATTGTITDANGQFVGIFLGLPYVFLQLLAGTVPAIVYGAKLKRVARPWLLVLLVVVAVLPALIATALTLACIVVSKTHGTPEY